MQSWLLRCVTSHDTVWYWIHQPLHLVIALHAEASVPGCIWFPYIPAGGPTRSVVHLSLMLHDESLINSSNLGTEAVCPFLRWETRRYRYLVSLVYICGAASCVSPPGRSGQVRGKSQPSHTDRITLTHRRRKNNKKKSFHRLWDVEMFRPGFGKSCCAGVTCSRWLSPWYGSLWGDQGAGEACICNAEEFTECSFSPKRAGERDVCVIRRPSYFLLFFLFSLKQCLNKRKTLSQRKVKFARRIFCFTND